MTYLLNLLIALDQLANAILLGSPDETLSSRAYRTDVKGRPFGTFFRPLIDSGALLVTLGHDRNHCYKAYLAELNKRQQPRDIRQAS